MENSSLCLESLNNVEEVNEELIEDVKAHADSVDLKWQRFLTFKYTFYEKIQEMDEMAEEDISADR